MTKQTARRARGGSLALPLLLVLLVVVLLSAGIGIGVATVAGQRAAKDAAYARAAGGLSAHTTLQQDRYRQLQLMSRIFATDQVLTGYLADATARGDGVKVLDFVEAYQNLLTFDLAVVLDRNGRVVARTDDTEAYGDDLSQTPMVATALEEERAFGVWSEGSSLYHAAAVPLVRDFDLAGYVIVALSIGEGLATQVARAAGAEVVYLANTPNGPQRSAATLDPARVAGLVDALRRNGEAIERVARRGETIDKIELSPGSGPVLAALTPLRDAAESPVGIVLVLEDLGRAGAGFGVVRLAQLGGGLAALALGSILTLALIRRAQQPQKALADAAVSIVEGRADVDLPKVPEGHLDSLRSALAVLDSERRERHALDGVLGAVARTLPEPAARQEGARPQTRVIALLGIEVRGHANPRAGYDPEATLARFGRDLRRIAKAVTARKGRVEAISGHRVLASFDGEDGPFRALASAAEAIHILSERENVFDEPDPPAIALVTGNAITGSVAAGTATAAAVVGLPVQQLESLLREAVPGEIYLSQAGHDALATAMTQAGVSLQPQRGMLSAQPLYALSREVAARVTGSASAAGLDDDSARRLADVAPGALVAGRFEILAELGAGRQAMVFKARDRDRDALVALKLLRPEVVAGRLEALTSRMRVLRGLDHPNVVPIRDFGEADGLPYVLMDYVRGMTLRYVLTQAGALPANAALPLMRHIALGLEAGHGAQVPHLDLRPENILIDTVGRAQIADFGMALDQPTVDLGTSAAYRAPEVLAGQVPDLCADVYAFGAIGYELLAGRPPVSGATVAEIQQRGREEIEPIGNMVANVPSALSEFVTRCLARDPAARFASGLEVVAALPSAR